MSLDVFQAYIAGYEARLFDNQILAVQVGYWAGYYGRHKKPKSIKTILSSMMNKRKRSLNKGKVTKPEVDVEAFLEMEAQFKRKQNKQKN